MMEIYLSGPHGRTWLINGELHNGRLDADISGGKRSVDVGHTSVHRERERVIQVQKKKL